MTREWSVFLVAVALAIVGDLWRGGRAPEPVAPPTIELDGELPDLLEEERPAEEAPVDLDEW